jgi:hypothetical protein
LQNGNAPYSYPAKKNTILQRLSSLQYYHFAIPLNFIWGKITNPSPRFFCGDVSCKYNKSLKNAVFATERTIELPLAIKQVLKSRGCILEVGNVLTQYFKFPHAVIDKYEAGRGVTNIDIVDFVPEKQYDLVVSISTLEHVGFDEEDKDSQKVLKALDKLFSVTRDNGIIFVSVPLGHNPNLDSYLRDGIIQAPEMHLMKRVSWKNEWIEQSLDLLKTEKFLYGSPYPFANWVLFMRWTK